MIGSYLCDQMPMNLRAILLIYLLLPCILLGQQTMDRNTSLTHLLADSLAFTNQIHGPYVGFSGERTDQYRRFETLTERLDCGELLKLCSHKNAVVRGYAFWGLARKHYSGLDSLLLAHAHDESPVIEIQGGVMNQIPLIEFMLWVVNPDMMDAESLKLDADTFRQVTELRFSEE